MNSFMDYQIKNMITMTKTFQQACSLAAVKDDGKIDKEEKEILKKINTASEDFIKSLEKIK